jgi:hypothetical protein
MTSVVRFGRNFAVLDVAVQQFKSKIGKRIFRAVCRVEKSGFAKELASVGYVSIIVINVGRDGCGIDCEAIVGVVVEAYPLQYIVVYGPQPINVLNHLLWRPIAHQYQLRSGLQRIFAVISSYPLRLSAKVLSQRSVIVRVYHELGVTLRLLANKKRVDACCQQTPSSWRKPMRTNALRRFKLTGTNAAQTPSRRPHHEASYNSMVQGAGMTATNQSPHTVQEVDGSD